MDSAPRFVFIYLKFKYSEYLCLAPKCMSLYKVLEIRCSQLNALLYVTYNPLDTGNSSFYE